MPAENRRVVPQGVGTSAVASPVGGAGQLRLPNLPVSDLAGGLSRFSAGLGDYQKKLQAEQDEADAIRAFDDVQSGRVGDYNAVDYDNESPSYIRSVYGALGQQAGYDSIRAFSAIVEEKAHSPDFDYETERERVIGSALGQIQDPNVLKGFYQVFDTQEETLHAKFDAAIQARTIETANNVFGANHFDGIVSQVTEIEPEAQLPFAMEADRAHLAAMQQNGTITPKEIAHQRISAIEEAVIRTGNRNLWRTFIEKDPNGASMYSHPVFGDMVRAAMKNADTVLGKKTGSENKLAQQLLGKELASKAEVGNTTEDQILAAHATGQITDGGAATALWNLRTYKTKVAQNVADLQAYLEGGPMPDPIREDLYDPNYEDRVYDIANQFADTLIDSGETPQTAVAAKYATFNQFGVYPKDFLDDLQGRIGSTDVEESLDAVEEFLANYDESVIAKDSLSRSTREIVNMTQAMKLYAGDDRQALVAAWSRLRDPEDYERITNKLRNAHRKTRDPGLQDMFGDTPGLIAMEKRVDAYAMAHMALLGLPAEQAYQVALEDLEAEIVDLTGVAGVKVHKDEVPAYVMSERANGIIRELTKTALATGGLDLGFAVDVDGFIEKAAYGSLSIPGMFISDVVDFEPWVFGADVDYTKVIYLPAGNGHLIMADEDGRYIGTIDWHKAVQNLPQELKEEMDIQHKAVINGSVGLNAARREPAFKPAMRQFGVGSAPVDKSQYKMTIDTPMAGSEPEWAATAVPLQEQFAPLEEAPIPEEDPVDQIVSTMKKASIPLKVLVRNSNIPQMPPKMLESFEDSLAERESSRRWDNTDNDLGYVGRYQFGAEALASVGLMNRAKYLKWKAQGGKGGQKAFMADDDNWEIEGGLQAYLDTPEHQTRALGRLMRQNYRTLRKLGGIDENTPADVISGLLYAAHLGGASRALKLAANPNYDFQDALGTSIHEYYRRGVEAARAVNPPIVPDESPME